MTIAKMTIVKMTAVAKMTVDNMSVLNQPKRKKPKRKNDWLSVLPLFIYHNRRPPTQLYLFNQEEEYSNPDNCSSANSLTRFHIVYGLNPFEPPSMYLKHSCES